MRNFEDLSAAVGWFQTTYSVRFNRRHRRGGHLASLVAQEADRRVAIWLRVRVRGQRMTELTKEFGYRDGSGGHRVVHRLEEAAQEDRDLAHRLQQLADRVSSVKS